MQAVSTLKHPCCLCACLCTVLWLQASVPGQLPPGQPIPERTATFQADSPLAEAVRIRLQLGQQSLEAERHAEAAEHYLAALCFGPASHEALRGLLAASKAEKDARRLWAHRYWLSVADARGRYKPDKKTLALLPEEGQWIGRLQALAVARAAAVEELSRYAGKLEHKPPQSLGNGVLVRWASDLVWDIVQPAPALQARYGNELNTITASHQPDYATVLQALRKTMVTASVSTSSSGTKPGTGPDDVGIRAARCLTGLAAQARFKDLKGPPPPDLARLPEVARQARQKIQARITRRLGEPLTVDELASMDAAQREAFTREHSTWANPGIAKSPNGLYVIQTICGHGTLLGCAQTVEMHHRRLANWFGKDPFQRRPGLVRIVPESSGMESEDSPFWWAGGFQSGDRTTVKFSWGSISGLGRGLTHELTHRFDGLLNPGMLSWIVEGRAVWTASAYGKAEDERFVERRLKPYSVQRPFGLGYGSPKKLRKLIEGTVEDYRDNYSAGYALYVFLATWKVEGKILYAKKLDHFVRRARLGRKKPMEWFLSHFADGKAGRPADLNGFAKMFNEFLRGCYKFAWGEGPAWVKADYVLGVGGGTRGGLVKDQPTWSWARNRAEPHFGQYHAARAGELLLGLGQERQATAALCWGLSTDGWQPGPAGLLAKTLPRLQAKDAAWVVGYEIGRRQAGPAGPGRAPMLAALPRLRAFIKTQVEAVNACQRDGMPLAARVLAREHDRVVGHVGLPAIGLPGQPPEATVFYPMDDPPRHLGLHGWVEDGLTGYEERRVRDLWFETSQGDLHVGRRRPRGDSGLLDRRAHQRHAFVRTVEWQPPGRYALRTRVHFTTSFVSGALILGYTRRDRNVRLHFRAGDFLYSIGRKDDPGKTKAVVLSMQGIWSREGHLHEAHPRHRSDFEKPSSFFDLELRVSGPTVRVLVQGEHIFTYATPDGSPIEGSIGFAMRQGAVRLQQPTVWRLDRGTATGLAKVEEGSGLDPTQAEPRSKMALLHATCRGIPGSRAGTIVIWIPSLEELEIDGLTLLNIALRRMRRLLSNPLHYPQNWVLAIPASLAKEERELLMSRAKGVAPDRFDFVLHKKKLPFEKRPWVLFVDSRATLQVADKLRRRGGTPSRIERWARTYRHGRTGH